MQLCRRCALRPAKTQWGTWYCYDCNPGRSGAPPCRRCGATGDYYTSGLCARCHRNSPRRLDSCLDCHAWGAQRRDKWLCQGCLGWRRKDYPVGVCAHCRRQVTIDGQSVCRLCRKQILTLPADERPERGTFIGWHQLFFADMFRSRGTNRRRRPFPRRRGNMAAWPPVRHRDNSVQLVMFELQDAPLPRPPWQPRLCARCGQRPVKTANADHCHGCVAGGPVTPPPCRRCGTTRDYYTSGLCIRCHRLSPARFDSCKDCFAWPARRGNSWLCDGCRGWRRRSDARGCSVCARPVAVDEDQVCRLCRKQVSMFRGCDTADLAELTRHGHQLFFAEMFTGLGATKAADAARRRRLRERNAEPAVVTCRPSDHVQLVGFEMRRDVAAARQDLPGGPADPVLSRYLDRCVTDHARGHGWGPSLTRHTRAGVRLLLTFQDTPGAAIKASDVVQLISVGVVARPILDVLAGVGWLDDDRTPSVELWFTRQTRDLPGPMAGELRAWFDVMLHGNAVPPRSRPRRPKTISTKLRWALPALRVFAAAGHESLREVTRADVVAVLPAAEVHRATTIQGLRSIFRVLRAHRLVFTDPTTRIRAGKPTGRIPLPAPVASIRAALEDTNPLRAAVAALLAFHGLQPGQLPGLQLTDIRDGRLHLNGRIIPLAGPVRDRLRAYLDYRNSRWPNTINPHLFVHFRTTPRTCPVQARWLTEQLGMSAQALREDRILDEARATGGDVRRLCDLFGLSVSGAERYASTIGHTDRGGSDASSRTPAPS